MSRAPDNPLELLKGMSRIVTPVSSDELERGRRQRVSRRIDGLLDGLRTRDRRSRARRLWALGALAATIALAVGLGSYRAAISTPDQPGAAKIRALSGDVRLVRAGRSSSASSAPDGLLGAADELRTAGAASAKLVLESQSVVAVAEGTTLRLGRAEPGRAPGERIFLTLGRVSLDVPSLAGGKFSVETPDALVTVRGTRFAVDVRSTEAGGTVTRVSVELGEVEVKSRGVQALLGPGAEWSSLVKLVALPPSTAAESAAPFESSAPKSAESAPAKSAGSTLAEENRLYESALGEAKRGNTPAALAGLERLIVTFPHSPLVPNAKAERSRLLRRDGEKPEEPRP